MQNLPSVITIFNFHIYALLIITINKWNLTLAPSSLQKTQISTRNSVWDKSSVQIYSVCRRQSGQRAQRVHDMQLQIPGRCRCCCCNTTLIRGWSAVETVQTDPRQTETPARACTANVGPRRDPLISCLPFSPRISLWEGQHGAIIARRLMREWSSEIHGHELE